MHILLYDIFVLALLQNGLREKCPNTESFLVCISRIRTKYGPEITPYLDTFDAVTVCVDHRY